MKSWARDYLFSIVVGLVLPGVLLLGALAFSANKRYYPDVPPETTVESAAAVSLPALVRLGQEAPVSMDMDCYLLGVLLGEMPAEFETDALMAQAVAARTFARKAWETGGKHGDGSVCDDPACCQAYLSPEAYLSQGGREAAVEKFRAAVNGTSGYVLYYDGKLIEATYFSSSGGFTEDAAAVWGGEFPYLKAVSSPEEVREETVSYSYPALESLLGVNTAGDSDIQITRTAGMGVDQARLWGVSFSGIQLRKTLGLRSTYFTVQDTGSALEITTRGFGHRVGMSQYGADAMAVSGSSWREILTHYYPGTELVRLEPEANQ